MNNSRKASIGAMAMFTDVLRTDSPERTLAWLKMNGKQFDREELLKIIEEMIIAVNMYGIVQLLEDVGVEIDEKYDELYSVI